MIALSIRQPWAWLIVNGYKMVENRTWATLFRGDCLIHAGLSMTRADYEACRIFIDGFCSIELPDPDDLQRGGIVGCGHIMDCVDHMDNPWFVGPFGFVFSSVRPLPFRFCRGRLGFFDIPSQPPVTRDGGEVKGKG